MAEGVFGATQEALGVLGQNGFDVCFARVAERDQQEVDFLFAAIIADGHIECAVVDLGFLRRLTFHAVNTLALIDLKRLYEAIDAVIGAFEAVFAREIVMESL